MNDLLSVIAELGLELHPERAVSVAKKVAGLSSVSEFAKVMSTFGPGTDPTLIERLRSAWAKDGSVSPTALAQALRTASTTATMAGQRGSVELVWTGPDSGQIPVRHTEQVVCEVIESAKHRLFVVSFVAYSVPRIVSALNAAQARGVQIDILLELSTAHGGMVEGDSVARMRKAVAQARLYVWKTRPPGSAVHAKCAVADDRIAFITSANLTTAAMERNMELGVLVRGGALPDALDRHLDALITAGAIVPA